jgi:hypothetical protein
MGLENYFLYVGLPGVLNLLGQSDGTGYFFSFGIVDSTQATFNNPLRFTVADSTVTLYDIAVLRPQGAPQG